MKKLQMLRVASRHEQETRKMLARHAPDILRSVKELGYKGFASSTGTKRQIRKDGSVRARIANNMRHYRMVRVPNATHDGRRPRRTVDGIVGNLNQEERNDG